jgi:peptide/nickel transport system permease protein
MEPLTWTGNLGGWLNPVLLVAAAAFGVALVLYLLVGLLAPAAEMQVNPDGTLTVRGGPRVLAGFAARATRALLLAVLLAYVVGGLAMPWGEAGIVGCIAKRFLPVWIALALTFALSTAYKRKLGLYGRLFDSTIGMIGFGLVMFWVYTAIAAGVFDLIATHDPLTAVSGLKNKVPGVPVPGAEVPGPGSHYLLGGDNLARDVFSRMVHGAWVVIQIAPLATVFAFMVGITLGLPAGYFGGRLDTFLSFLANLILAFPVILLFYLLVTPEMIQTGIPSYMAVGLFLFPLIFAAVLLWSRFHTQREKAVPMLAVTLFVLGWLYLSLVSQEGTPVAFMGPLDLFDIPGGVLVVFVSVVFVNAPTVFRIVRGLTLDIKTRDYVAAAQTRGETPWYIMLWEILPNARGPLIVDFCLRIGYTTILLGTLGFFGLGLPPDSPDWGSTINAGRQLLSVFPHPALVPAVALLSLVLGLNLLADGLREESMRD